MKKEGVSGRIQERIQGVVVLKIERGK